MVERVSVCTLNVVAWNPLQNTWWLVLCCTRCARHGFVPHCSTSCSRLHPCSPVPPRLPLALNQAWSVAACPGAQGVSALIKERMIAKATQPGNNDRLMLLFPEVRGGGA